MHVEKMEELGWHLTQTGPKEWEWVKFNQFGEVLAYMGDETWLKDREETDD